METCDRSDRFPVHCKAPGASELAGSQDRGRQTCCQRSKTSGCSIKTSRSRISRSTDCSRCSRRIHSGIRDWSESSFGYDVISLLLGAGATEPGISTCPFEPLPASPGPEPKNFWSRRTQAQREQQGRFQKGRSDSTKTTRLFVSCFIW